MRPKERKISLIFGGWGSGKGVAPPQLLEGIAPRLASRIGKIHPPRGRPNQDQRLREKECEEGKADGP